MSYEGDLLNCQAKLLNDMYVKDLREVHLNPNTSYQENQSEDTPEKKKSKDSRVNNDSHSTKIFNDLEQADYNQKAHRLFSWYLHGQLADVIKAAIWWSTYGVLVEAVSGYALAVAFTRSVFNFALVILSPMASAMINKISMRTLLLTTTGGRLLLWCVVIPLSWLFFSYSKIFIFDIAFIVLMFFDGAQVSFSNVVDIDCGGLDTLGQQYGLSIGNYLRDRFDRIHQIFFDASFIVLTPPCAFLIWKLATRVQGSCKILPISKGFLSTYGVGSSSGSFSQEKAVPACGFRDVAVLLGGICLLFSILSLFSMWNYRCFPNPQQFFLESNLTGVQNIQERPEEHNENNTSLENQQTSTRIDFLRVIRHSFKDFKAGLEIVMKETTIKWRLVFLALETALEDSVVSIIIPQLSIQLAGLLVLKFKQTSLTTPLTSVYSQPIPGGWAFVNLIAVSYIAVGKCGGLIAATYMNSHWAVPYSLHVRGPYLLLFKYMLISGLSMMLIPIGYSIILYPEWIASLLEHVFLPRTATIIILSSAIVCLVTAFFIFFVYSAVPKIGFATLLHSLVLHRDVEAKVFGCIGTCVTLTDALVILLINTIFAQFSGKHFIIAVWISSSLYAIHGFCEYYIAPYLILYQDSDVVESGPDFSRTINYIDESIISPPRDGSKADRNEFENYRLNDMWNVQRNCEAQPSSDRLKLFQRNTIYANDPLSTLDKLMSKNSDDFVPENPPMQELSNNQQFPRTTY